VNRFVAGLTLSLSCLAGAQAAEAPAPYELGVAIHFTQSSGDEGLREEFELQLLSELRRSACFRSVELDRQDPENEPRSETAELLLRIGVDELFEETVYDTSIAERADSRALESLDLAHTARFSVVVSASLEHSPHGKTLRSRRIRGHGAHRPLVAGEDARHIALREASSEAANSVRSFVCKGGAKRLRKQIAALDVP